MNDHTIRRYSADDAAGVLEVINHDHVEGQPVVTSQMLSQALAGRNNVDSGWWAELSNVVTEVAASPDGLISGVISYARRERDNAGVILWLHAAENDAVIRILLDRALKQLKTSAFVEAFSFASALTIGLEALPGRHRPRTHAALIGRGFTFEDMWRYMHRHLPAPDIDAISYTTTDDGDARKLQVHDGTKLIAEATIGLPVHGIGVLWWISVEPAARGRGLGRRLLSSALDLLAGLGAKEVILYVDDDEPGGDRDRAAANRLYDQAGFAEVDRLYSYRRAAK
jgi:ribosomal protein S18 acetylase RimI-like enzyme